MTEDTRKATDQPGESARVADTASIDAAQLAADASAAVEAAAEAQAEAQSEEDAIQAELERRERIRKPLAVVPTLLTVCNGVFGFAAILSFMKAYALLQPAMGEAVDAVAKSEAFRAAGQNLLEGCIFIALSMTADMLDGWAARKTGTDSRFGAMLDSLCDVISFGAAPAVLLRVFGEALYGVGMNNDPSMSVRLLWAVSALYVACSVLRLARFTAETSDDDDHRIFFGLPIPAAAGGIASLYVLCWDADKGVFLYHEVMRWVLPASAIAISLLMVSRVVYAHFFNRVLASMRSIAHFAFAFVVLGFVYVVGGSKMLFVAPMLAYVMSGPLLWVLARMRGGKRRRSRA